MTARSRVALAVLTLPVLLISVDMTVLGAALPAIDADLAPTGSQQLWMVDIYSFVLAGLLVVMGGLGDRVGRRRLLLVGTAAFGVASVLAAMAASAEALIAARALLGLGGATLMPSTLSLIKTVFPDPAARRGAVAVWSAAFAGGAAAGPVIGGWLLEHFTWHAVFLIAVPVTLALLAVGPFVLPESRDPHPGPFDLVSAALALLAVLPVVYALKSAATEGVSVAAGVAAAVGLAAGAVFVLRQRTLRHPLLDLTLLRRRPFQAAIATNMLSIVALVGLLLLLPQHLQLVLGYSPLEAALWMLPGALAGIGGSLLAARVARRVALRTVVTAGLGIAAVGLVVLATAPGTLALLVVGFGIAGGGIALAEALTNDVVVAVAPPERAGAASAISETGYELGGALGTTILGSVSAAVFVAELPGEDTLSGALVHAATRGDDALAGAATTAFTDGLSAAALAGAAFLLVAAVQAWFRLRDVDDAGGTDGDTDGVSGAGPHPSRPSRPAARSGR